MGRRRAADTRRRGTGRVLVLIVALAAPVHADTLAFGAHGGVCLDCMSDQMHWLGGGIEGEHTLMPRVQVRVDIALDSLGLKSDECQYDRTGQRALAAAGLRTSSVTAKGLFAALTAGAMLAHQKTTCPHDDYDSTLGVVLRPQLGWDIQLTPHDLLRLELASDVQWESDLHGSTPLVEIEGGALLAFQL